MKRTLVFTLIGIFVFGFSGFAQESEETETKKEEKPIRWLIEPIKLSSLMVNTHPEYTGWGLELGRKLSDKVWFTSMIEKTKGGDFAKNFDPNFDFLVTFDYFAWLNTARYYLKPEKKYSTIFDGGFVFQKVRQKYLRNNQLIVENATAVGPLLMVGGELKMRANTYFKWRFGGFLNVFRDGSFVDQINDGQDQAPYQLYPHLSDAAIGAGSYAGDIALGLKF